MKREKNVDGKICTVLRVWMDVCRYERMSVCTSMICRSQHRPRKRRYLRDRALSFREAVAKK